MSSPLKNTALFSSLLKSLPIQISLLLYIVIQGTLLYTSSWHIHLEGELGKLGDAAMYYENALSILEGRPYTFLDRQPFYSLFLLCILGIFGKTSTVMCVVFQFLLHLGLSLYAFKIANLIIPKWKKAVFILVLLNPNSIFHSHILITETLYAFLFSVAYYWLLLGSSTKNWRLLLGSGVFVGFMALTRPEGKFFLYLLPFGVFYVYGIINGFRSSWKTVLILSTIAWGIGFLMVLPWKFYLSEHHALQGISTSQKQSDHLGFTLAILENIAQGKTDVIDTYTSFIIPQAEEAFSKELQNSKTSLLEKHAFLNGYFLKKFLTYSPRVYARAFLQSWSILYLGSGTQIFMRLIHQPSSIPKDFQHKPNIFEEFREKFRSPLSFSISAVFFLGNLILRILDMVGILALFLRKQYKWLFVTFPPVVFITFIVLCDGQSRARLLLEPILMIWAVLGFMYLKEQIASLKRVRIP